jgi:DNA replication and repair protein RecF
MDRLFTGSAGDRRRFLDRLVLALEPAHAHHSSRYEAAMRARNKLLADDRWDEDWLNALEAQMTEHGLVLSEARRRSVEALDAALSSSESTDFPSGVLALEGWDGGDLAARLGRWRSGGNPS